MFLHLALLGFIFNALFGIEYDLCQQKIFDANIHHRDSLVIPVKKDIDLVYSQNEITRNVLKYDPFLSLYLVKHINNFPYPFYFNQQSKNLYLIDAFSRIHGNVTFHQVGLNNLAKFSISKKKIQLIVGDCCFFEAILGKQGIIEKDYIYRFVFSEKVLYGDIGIRVKDQDNKVIVIASNPYIKTNKLHYGDILLKFDNKNISNASEFMKWILFGKLDSLHFLEIKRKNKKMIYKVKILQRFGGGRISDTFLEQYGLFFDHNLKLIKVAKKNKILDLEVGDQLIQVNGIRVKKDEDVRTILSNTDRISSFLILRDGFEFFINIDQNAF